MAYPLLQINHLKISFTADGNTTVAVDDCSFSAAPGEVVAVVGESGSGKSVTSLSLLQLLPAQANLSGQLLFSKNGTDVTDLLQCSETQINSIRGKEIAMIFQEPMTSLNPVFTCGSQVMEAIMLHKGVNKENALAQTIALFEKVKLPDPSTLVHRFPHQLSGGQKQRVMIAMAMSCNPALLIADEPTTALDVTVQKTILELIKELQQQNNMGVIFITHDLGVVAEVADKIVVLLKGNIVEQGPAKQILEQPQHPYTKALLACRPAIHPKGQRLPVVSDFLEPGKAAIPTTAKPSLSAPIQATDNTTPALTVEHLTVHYTGKKKLFAKAGPVFKAVDDVSFCIAPGETVGLVGESGCGKTTLGRAILQLVKPTSGRVLLGKEDVSRLSATALRQLRRDLQIVFQDPYGSLNPRLTIGDAIMEPLEVHHILNNNRNRRDKVMELLEKVSLQSDHFNRYPHQFSGGQRQRICIARALALNPSFLIFDESVSALDVSVQAQVLNLINDLKAEFGFSSIFISHDLSVVRYISNRILVMYKGQLVEEGEADSVYHHPKHAYTQKLIEAIPGRSLTVF